MDECVAVAAESFEIYKTDIKKLKQKERGNYNGKI